MSSFTPEDILSPKPENLSSGLSTTPDPATPTTTPPKTEFTTPIASSYSWETAPQTPETPDTPTRASRPTHTKNCQSLTPSPLRIDEVVENLPVEDDVFINENASIDSNFSAEDNTSTHAAHGSVLTTANGSPQGPSSSNATLVVSPLATEFSTEDTNASPPQAHTLSGIGSSIPVSTTNPRPRIRPYDRITIRPLPHGTRVQKGVTVSPTCPASKDCEGCKNEPIPDRIVIRKVRRSTRRIRSASGSGSGDASGSGSGSGSAESSATASPASSKTIEGSPSSTTPLIHSTTPLTSTTKPITSTSKPTATPPTNTPTPSTHQASLDATLLTTHTESTRFITAYASAQPSGKCLSVKDPFFIEVMAKYQKENAGRIADRKAEAAREKKRREEEMERERERIRMEREGGGKGRKRDVVKRWVGKRVEALRFW